MSQKQLKSCVIGYPIKHSLSPKLHGFWLNQYQLSGDYRAVEVPPDELDVFIKNLPDNGYQGCNITLPHKIDAMKYVDTIDPIAREIGAINTVIVKADRTLFGTNTDAYGFIHNLKQQQPQWVGKGRSVLVLGAGGAARAIISALIHDGVKHIYLTNRTRTRAEELKTHFDTTKCDISIIDWSDKETALNAIDLLVNTTSLGMSGKSPLELDLSKIAENCIVYDIVYTPLYTDLLKQAEKKSCPIVTGLGMLLHQGRPGFEAWFGHAPDVTDALEQYMLEQTS